MGITRRRQDCGRFAGHGLDVIHLAFGYENAFVELKDFLALLVGSFDNAREDAVYSRIQVSQGIKHLQKGLLWPQLSAGDGAKE
jgi:hypothetical protein